MINFFLRLPAKVSLALLRFWHRLSEPIFGQQCRFYPSCSVYASEAIERYGFVKGWFLAGKRVLRCHPFSSGGVDPVPGVEGAGAPNKKGGGESGIQA